MNLQQYKMKQLSEEELEVMTQKLVTAHLDNDYRKKWKNKLAEEYDIHRSPKGKQEKDLKIKWWTNWKTAVAVILIAMIAVPSFFLLNRGLEYEVDALIAADQFVNKVGGKKGASLEEEALRTQATLTYTQGDYQAALELYRQLLQGEEVKQSDHFYAGLCFLKLNRAEESIPQFLKVREKMTAADILRQETNWYLALAFAQNGQRKESQEELENIQQGEWNYAKAQKLLTYF